MSSGSWLIAHLPVPSFAEWSAGGSPAGLCEDAVAPMTAPQKSGVGAQRRPPPLTPCLVAHPDAWSLLRPHLWRRRLRARRGGTVRLRRLGPLRGRQRLAAQHLQRILQLRILFRFLRHVIGGAGTFLAVLRLAFEVASQGGFAWHPVACLRLQFRRQLLLDSHVGLDALGLNGSSGRRVVPRGGKADGAVLR